MNVRRSGTLAAMLVATWLAAALPAAAHPSFRPSRVAPGETVAAELVIPHSCGAEGMPHDDEDQSPTTIVAIRVPDGMRLTPLPPDGWTVTRTDDGFEWTDPTSSRTTTLLDVEIEVLDDTATTLFVDVYQECANGGSFSWIGTPDLVAEFPAAVLTVGDGEGPTDHGGRRGEATEPTGHATEHGTDDPTEHESDPAAHEVAVPGGNGLGGVALVGIGIVGLAVAAGRVPRRRA